jgi:hypothetical protein
LRRVQRECTPRRGAQQAKRRRGRLPETRCRASLAPALPADPEAAYALVRAKLDAAVQRLNMKPQQFYNTMNQTKAKSISREAMRLGLHRLTKYTITDRVLDDVLKVPSPPWIQPLNSAMPSPHVCALVTCLLHVCTTECVCAHVFRF